MTRRPAGDNPPLERTAAAVYFTCGRASRVRRLGRSTASRYATAAVRSMTAMNTSEAPIVVYDSKRLPLWLRVPALAFGLFLCVIWTHLVCEHVLGVRFRISTSGPTGTPMGVPVAVTAVALLALFFVNLWIARRRILLVNGGQELSVEVRWLFGTSRDRISVPATVRVEVRRKTLKASTFWDIYAVNPADRFGGWLTRCYSAADANEVGEKIANAIGRPVAVA